MKCVVDVDATWWVHRADQHFARRPALAQVEPPRNLVIRNGPALCGKAGLDVWRKGRAVDLVLDEDGLRLRVGVSDCSECSHVVARREAVVGLPAVDCDQDDLVGKHVGLRRGWEGDSACAHRDDLLGKHVGLPRGDVDLWHPGVERFGQVLRPDRAVWIEHARIRPALALHHAHHRRARPGVAAAPGLVRVRRHLRRNAHAPQSVGLGQLVFLIRSLVLPPRPARVSAAHPAAAHAPLGPRQHPDHDDVAL
mmetsp:Transcript_27417/g.88525  ORF Transcript_27417/g.88525 Transcript_27417/m.88525 type:complete len:252 (+) Transcript_27417:1496-2251(+)